MIILYVIVFLTTIVVLLIVLGKLWSKVNKIEKVVYDYGKKVKVRDLRENLFACVQDIVDKTKYARTLSGDWVYDMLDKYGVRKSGEHLLCGLGFKIEKYFTAADEFLPPNFPDQYSVNGEILIMTGVGYFQLWVKNLLRDLRQVVFYKNIVPKKEIDIIMGKYKLSKDQQHEIILALDLHQLGELYYTNIFDKVEFNC